MPCCATARPTTETHSFVSIPCQQTNASQTAGRERTPKVCEREHRVVEEHQTELADGKVEGTFGEGIGLRVRGDELGVVDRRGAGSIGRDLQQRLGEVHADRGAGPASRHEGRRTATTADVEHRMVWFESYPLQQGVGEWRELAVVPVGVDDEVHRLGAVPGFDLLLVGDHAGSSARVVGRSARSLQTYDHSSQVKRFGQPPQLGSGRPVS